MSALRWLSRGDWSTWRHSGTALVGGALTLAPAGPGFARRGVAVLRAGRPDAAQVDGPSADRWREVSLRLAAPLPPSAWVRLWTLVTTGGVEPAPPDLTDGVDGLAMNDAAPSSTPPEVWRAAAVDACDARVLCLVAGDLYVAVELGGRGEAVPRVADVLVTTGDDGPITALPVAYRGALGVTPTDDGDGVLGRYLGLFGAQLRHTASVLDELPALLSPAGTADRDDAPWLERLAEWVAVDPALLPVDDADRRETVATAVERHGWRGTRRGLVDQVRRETTLDVDVVEPIQDAEVWRLDGRPGTSALGLTTGLLAAEPGPPVLDNTALLDASQLVAGEDAGLPVHARVAHRICVLVPGGTAAQVAAVDRVVQRERPAHVLAHTCAVARQTVVPTRVGVDLLPGAGAPGLWSDEAYRVDIPGPGTRLGTGRIPGTPDPIETTGAPR